MRTFLAASFALLVPASALAAPREAQTGLLAAPAFSGILEAEERQTPPPADLRDALAPAAPAAAPLSRDAALRQRLRGTEKPPLGLMGFHECRDGAANLRFMVEAANFALGDRRADRRRLQRRIASGLARELDVLRRLDAPSDALVSLAKTDAEVELESALKRLESLKLSDAAFRRHVLTAASRAAAGLESAARRLSAE